jgi:hypothetical protein
VERDSEAGGLGGPQVDDEEEGTARTVAEEYRIGDEFEVVVRKEWWSGAGRCSATR